MKILVIGDTHLPCEHPQYLRFCQDLRDQNKCDTVVHIGDIVDFHAISFHVKHPEAKGPTDEYELAYEKMRPWVRAFPKMSVCIGNHDSRIVRLAETVNIPAKFIRDYKQIWETPRWEWENDYIKDDVYYFHGTGCGGIHPAFTAMQKHLMSVCMGHIHSAAGVKWRANPQRRIFGLDVSCGVDDRAYAFAYGRNQIVRSLLGAAVVLDGVPMYHIMPCGPGEKYNRKRVK